MRGMKDERWAASRKEVPNVLSLCHTKRRTGMLGRARPSFGTIPTFFFSIYFYFLVLKIRCHTKRRAGMTTTLDIRDLFV